ncbi:MAG: hypothetical protein HQK53_17265 [Oligoflexia bacterium]|nr:hypothetical protein [Oligoflexia bacterium]
MKNIAEKIISLENARRVIDVAARDPNVHADGFYQARKAGSSAWKEVRQELANLTEGQLFAAEDSVIGALKRSGPGCGGK